MSKARDVQPTQPGRFTLARRKRWALVVSLAAAGAAILAAFVAKEAKHMSEYAWLASNSAPRGCPIEIRSGAFFFQGGGSLYIPATTLHEGWGKSVSSHAVGPATKPLPDRMEIDFYSLLEDKVYSGEFTLPYHRIAQLFSEGFDTYDTGTRSHVNYTKIVAGVAPGGTVAVWVSGIDRQVEVFFGKADESTLDWHQAMGLPSRVNRREWLEVGLSTAAKGDPLVPISPTSLRLDVWSAYRTRYPWRPVFEGLAAPERIGRIRFFNGERESLPLPLDPVSQTVPRPVPSYLHFVQKRADQRGLRFELTFDEDETLSAFKRLSRSGETLELVFRQPKAEQLTASLRNGDESVALTRAKIEVYLDQ